MHLHGPDPWPRHETCSLIVYLCDHGFEESEEIWASLSVLLIDNSEIDDLHLVRVSPSGVSAVKAGYTAEICYVN